MQGLLNDWRRTNYANECTPEIAGSDITIMGWVHEIRDFGGIMFVIIRDVTGRVQITAPSKKVDEISFVMSPVEFKLQLQVKK